MMLDTDSFESIPRGARERLAMNESLVQCIDIFVCRATFRSLNTIVPQEQFKWYLDYAGNSQCTGSWNIPLFND
jgi:hypothetical protein